MHVSISQRSGRDQHENCFYSFQSFFGKAEYDSQTSSLAVLHEDKDGWLGKQDLVVISTVPTFGLLTGPRNGIKVALKLNASPENLMLYGSALGMTMVVFESGFEDNRCFVCQDVLGHSLSGLRTAQERWILTEQASKRQSTQTLVQLDDTHQARYLKFRLELPQGSAASKALAEGAGVTIEHKSPAVVTVCIGKSIRKDIAYAIPIDGSKPKTRIARKSSWIEVAVPLATHHTNTFDSWTQMLCKKKDLLLLSDIPRINFSIQPRPPHFKKQDSEWIRVFMGTTLSDREKALNDISCRDRGSDPSSGNVLIDIKQTLNILICSFAGQHPSAQSGILRPRVFHFSIDNSCHTIIFATALYHDLDLGSVCLEAYVLPLTIPKVMKLQPALAAIQNASEFHGIHVTPEESILWKRLLPALAERCRTYPHKDGCEYLRAGATIPLSTAEAESPICSCGEGQVREADFVKMGGRGAKTWKPFANHVTRIAISPIFPVPFLESSMDHIKEKFNEQRAGSRMATALNNMSNLAIGAGDRSNANSTGEKCGHCGKAGGSGLKTCAGCGKAKYCGGACQKADWKKHKPGCKKG